MKKNKYIFATDVDGTVLMDNGQVHPETLAAFKLAQEKQHITVIATGRSIIRTKSLLTKIPYIDYFICNNGALIHDVKNNQSIYVKGVNPYYYPKVVDFARKYNLIFKLHTDQDWIGDVGTESDLPTILTPEMDHKIREYIKANPESEKLYNGHIPTQLSVNGPEEFCKKHLNSFVEWFGKDASVFLTNSVFLDVNPKNTSKWTGLLQLANYLNLRSDHIVTFGDSLNDLEMLQGAGDNGYPLANSKLELTEIIPAKIGSNNTNAIGLKILEYLAKS